MANRKNWLGILVIVLVFGMMVVGCDDGSGGTDPALNGTWVKIITDDYDTEGEITFNNGNFEVKVNGEPYAYAKGTYTTSGNKITRTVTSYRPSESGWYSKAEYKTYLETIGYPYSDAQLNEYINQIFGKQTLTYSISGNTLILTGTNPETGETSTETYTKK